MADNDLTVEILKAMRNEMRERFDGVDKRFDAVDHRFDAVDQRFDVLEERVALTNQRLDITNERLGVVESTLLTLARRQRSMNKVLNATAAGVSQLDVRVTDLEARVGRLENR